MYTHAMKNYAEKHTETHIKSMFTETELEHYTYTHENSKSDPH